MKCDKLNEKIQITNDTRMVYLKSEVDAAIAELKAKLEDEREFGLNHAKNADYEIGKLNEKIIVLKKSYKKLVKKFVHEISVAESYQTLRRGQVLETAAGGTEGGKMKSCYFGRKRWYDADEVDKILAELRENNKKAFKRDAENWNRLCVKYNKLIELKKEFCEKFDDILKEIEK